ncbi:unnamed protein product [Rotaria socialis]|uniref:Shisa N-terminal domain-containing protein n=1 Tax=Rotaria socialis TaxID=392032 RepID=A0A817LC21_9BILA|nr:unnamed protein product [Rotaria socialis]CAF3354807.1 unnamed protein product [Rotaria socialis]CAF3506936.1 unnamed protein product [Rotaria socialis]CAF3568209.1 unnamed protein product [Rotaria socialis]
MTLFRPAIIRTQLIILFIFVVATNIDCRPGGRGKIVRIRVSSRNLVKNKFHLKNMYRQSPILHQSHNHILIRGATRSASALLVGTLALRSYVSNNHKQFSQSRHTLTNGTGSLCVNRENFSNFIFNEFRCPLLPIFPHDNYYCCGPSQRQYCCSFWKSSRVAGFIIGIMTASSLLIVCIYYYRYRLTRKESQGVKSYLMYPIQTSLYSNGDTNHYVNGK